jgi:type I restriction enzyme S subunit
VKLPAYPRYKPSGVGWLGDVPEHWDVKPLKYSASINDEALPETTPPDFDLEYVDIGGVNAVDGITGTEELVFENAPSRARRLVRHGDTIVSTVRTYLRAIAPIKNPPENLIVSTGFAVVRPRRVDSAFLGYALRESSFVESVVSRSVGVSYPAVNASEVGGIPIPLPDRAEQEAIAAFLDRETGQVDQLVAKKRELIERLKEKRTALISCTVTQGLSPAAARAAGAPENPPFKSSGLEWLGDIPKHWRVGPLKSLAKDGRKTFTDGDWVELPFITDEGIRLIQTGNVGIGAYKEQGYRYVSEASFSELRCTEVVPSDVLICRLDGPVGRACLAPNLGVRMITSVDNTILKARDTVLPLFVVYLLSSAPWLSWIDALCRVGGGFRVRISRTMLGNIQVPIPPFPEQTAIVRYLDAETTKLDAMVGKVKEAIERLLEYRTALVTAGVTGKIDVRKESHGK